MSSLEDFVVSLSGSWCGAIIGEVGEHVFQRFGLYDAEQCEGEPTNQSNQVLIAKRDHKNINFKLRLVKHICFKTIKKLHFNCPFGNLLVYVSFFKSRLCL